MNKKETKKHVTIDSVIIDNNIKKYIIFIKNQMLKNLDFSKNTYICAPWNMYYYLSEINNYHQNMICNIAIIFTLTIYNYCSNCKCM
jgi:hypothetical protein